MQYFNCSLMQTSKLKIASRNGRAENHEYCPDYTRRSQCMGMKKIHPCIANCEYIFFLCTWVTNWRVPKGPTCADPTNLWILIGCCVTKLFNQYFQSIRQIGKNIYILYTPIHLILCSYKSETVTFIDRDTWSFKDKFIYRDDWINN